MTQIERIYDSRLLKGTGLIQEMLVLIEAYKPGESTQEFQKRVLVEGILSKSTNNRTIDIVNRVFRPRFLNQRLEVATYIQLMRDNYVSMDVITQLFLLYTCRENSILADFIYDIYYPLAESGKAQISHKDPIQFIQSAMSDGRIENSWSESTIKGVASRINSCLIDFELIDRSKQILPYRAHELTVNYLLHELHFQGYSDTSILHHEDWKIFNLDPSSLAVIAEKLSFSGTFIFQYSGEILNINWKYKNMEEFIENECR